MLSNKEPIPEKLVPKFILNVPIKYIPKPTTIEFNLDRKNYTLCTKNKEYGVELIELKQKNTKLKKENEEKITKYNDLKEFKDIYDNLISENKNLEKEKDEIKKKIEKIENDIELSRVLLHSNIFESKDDLEFIKKKLLNISIYENQFIKLKLIYQLSKNGSNISDFHKLCKNISDNIILVKTTENQRFGGFTQNSWTGNKDRKYDNKAFCFSLTKKKIYEKKQNGTFSIGDYNKSLCFSDMFTIGVGVNGLLNEGYCPSCNGNNLYNQTIKWEINDGRGIFLVEELEFYQVSFK